ncbi:choline ABC transporter substrate-binding protein [Sinorhizobium prairiense]|uniref:choline ABC transporter substrate-binding protein n=1 Tax=unclassified Sinorhizobium TaxID=2613772 RepID=UPI0023D891D0|nr:MULTISPECIES: choline ABC transporter substrate-binding protein [unclassified Sinorhizobium]WEJ13714.1 choline ABC transporter substrate-binding protein [Sinorhizobium sp. M103]WEJ19177.1 choline ABC transporter substrate-binding protein [Sinorhizobium sp. K101]WEJ40085.1 choline ABC transporter substrate-binding protein [Sinorhizobium sp. C101]
MLKQITAMTAGLLMTIGVAAAAEPESCKTVRFSDVGWTDITSTTAVASTILEALGYAPQSKLLSIPVTYASMKNKDIDVYLGDWQPSMEADRKPFLEDKSIEVIGPNLTGAKYTFAVPKYVADAGVKDISDLQKFSDRFGRKIYGIEPGNNGNRMILDMIEKGDFGLTGWELVESSEQGMLAEVERATKDDQWIVFLGWAPHPMNSRYQIDYLSGADAYFGPNYGGADIYTNIRAGYAQECPNVAKFVTNLRFTLEMENEIMNGILNDGKDPKEAAADWLKAHPEAVAPWLEGVTTFNGAPAKEAVESALKS